MCQTEGHRSFMGLQSAFKKQRLPDCDGFKAG